MTSANRYLGYNVENHDKLFVKAKDLSEKISKKKSQFDTMKTKLEKLKDLNNKLTNGYELSLRMVVDVSKLLHMYTKMFDDLESVFGNMDDELSIQQEDIKYVSELTKDSIKKIQDDFNKQYPTIVDALEKSGSKDTRIMANKLKMIVNELPTDAQNLNYEFSRQTTGGAIRAKTPNKKSAKTVISKKGST
jgi:hypothetical protein